MGPKIWKCLPLAVAALLCLAPCALADSTANMVLTGAGSTVLGNVYIGPYTATINGVSTLVICDDFSHASFLNESWVANISTFPSLSKVTFANGQPNQGMLYDEVAWLSLQLLNPANASQAGEIQYALWNVFDPGSSGAIAYLGGFSATDASIAMGWYTAAQTQTYTPGEFSNVLIYTPNGTPPTCSGGPCPSAPPQEFIVVTTPEPASALLLGFGLAGLFLLKRRKQQVA